MDSYSDFYENRMLKSEYQLERYIKSYLSRNDKPCQFCQSDNLEISDIEFDGRRAMCDQEVVQLQLVFSKDENGQIEVRTGGTRYLPNSFLPEAFKLIDKAIANTPNSEFEEKPIGNIRFVVSTGFIGNDNERTNRLEQFSFVGFSKEDTIDYVAQIKSQILRNHR